MPITFNCTCGKTLRVPDANAGRRAKCPACNAVVNVPAPEVDPVFEVVEEATPPVGAKPYGKPVDDDDSDDRTPYGLASESREDDDAPRGKRLPNFRKGRDKHT